MLRHGIVSFRCKAQRAHLKMHYISPVSYTHLFSMQRKNIFSYDDLAIQRGLRMLYRHRKMCIRDRPRSYMMIWVLMSFASFFLEMVCWYAKGEGAPAVLDVYKRQHRLCAASAGAAGHSGRQKGVCPQRAALRLHDGGGGRYLPHRAGAVSHLSLIHILPQAALPKR